MSELQCPNCKERYKFVKSDDRYYKFLYVHDHKGCPFGLETYQHSKE